MLTVHPFRLQADELQGLIADAATAGVPEQLQVGLKRLFSYLQDASNDAASFAAQARQDAQRHKHSEAVPAEDAQASARPSNGDAKRMDGVAPEDAAAASAAADAPNGVKVCICCIRIREALGLPSSRERVLELSDSWCWS